ncbi:S1C family serine protease [Clostridium folliculivorans]|uniref:Serine protease n=1 Tax=Clostridium folliculivorans TaxID=2886038 RepID=A0A9W5Y431_9CLOT|nr:S1C family serine protease [Clostridium folliculivorans]GKU26138.1 serine protease [Clostridium folliculivorans]GKU28224.1 serine protease [Clostridium folliculivorans]
MEKEDKTIRIEKSSKKDDTSSLEGMIRFKENKRRNNIKRLTKGIIIILVASVAGAISGAYIVERKYGLKLKDSNKTIFQIIDTRESSATSGEGQISSVVSKVSPSIVSISNKEENFNINSYTNVTGIIYKEDGYIVTNYSSISTFDKILVKRAGLGIKIEQGRMIGYDKTTDLAVVKIDSDKLPVVKISDLSDVREGGLVIALGNCIGDDYIGLVTSGIITSTNIRFNVENADLGKQSVRTFQTNAIINRENNGGALTDIYGEVIGINNLPITNKYSSQGLGIAINIQDAKKIIDSIISDNEVKLVNLGFRGWNLTSKQNKDIEGVYVESVVAKGSADAAGMKPFDIIIEMDGRKIKTLTEINDVINSHNVGDNISCKVLRGKNTVELTMKLLQKV